MILGLLLKQGDALFLLQSVHLASPSSTAHVRPATKGVVNHRKGARGCEAGRWWKEIQLTLFEFGSRLCYYVRVSSLFGSSQFVAYLFLANK